MRSSPGTCALLALLLALACGPPERTAEPFSSVLVVGVDGLEWSVLRPLLAEGRCPNLRALIERGSFGQLATFIPTYSPIVWTSIATGKEPAAHGISNFVDAEGREFTSARREGRALWNIADRYGLTSNVFGWWITWPAEPIRGLMVSATSASAMADQNWKPALMEGLEDQVHPPELSAPVLALAATAGGPERVRAVARQKVFGDIPEGVLGPVEQTLVRQTLWSVQSDETFFRVAEALLPEHPADLNLIYFGGPDVAGHRFWRQHEPAAFAYGGSSPEADAALAGVLRRYYEWIDEMLGRLVALVGEDSTILVVSDHGMHAVATDRPNARHTTGDHQDGAPGVLIAAGPGIVRQGGVALFLETGALPTHGSVLAVTPTVLGLLGIPPSREMSRRAHRAILVPEVLARIDALPPVDTHDDGFRPATLLEVPAEKEAEFRARMEALGYLDGASPSDVEPLLVDPARFEPDPRATNVPPGDGSDGG